MVLRPEVLVHPLTAVLRQVEARSCPRRFNFHCHTRCSDGSLRPAELAAQAVALGLEHLAVTDHHSVTAHGPLLLAFAQLAASGERVPQLWRGLEISALLDGCLVHVLALGCSHNLQPLAPYLQGVSAVGPALRAEAVVAAIHAAGGLALLAHPARYRLPHRRLIAAAAALGFDGGEAWYDYEQKPQWAPSALVCAAIAADLDKRGLLQSCGTDTHGLVLSGR